TFLFPNPASDQVQVASSFRISTVEVYSLSGQLVSRVKADGISATLDTRSLPSATYLVRIATNHGTAVKKLVIE
ncbi:MAG: T9SS type A sorting domain-containing protein, partial [Bacteroidales bacterium]|nr:T9SS type A sorting domain-containing protein [Bacteroidales bacterium]